MNTKNIKFKGVWLDPNSRAYQLFQDKKMDELNKHVDEVLKKQRQLEK